MGHLPCARHCAKHTSFTIWLYLKTILAADRLYYLHVLGWVWALEQLSSQGHTVGKLCQAKAKILLTANPNFCHWRLFQILEFPLLLNPKFMLPPPTPFQIQKTEQVFYSSNFAEDIVEIFYIKGMPSSPALQRLNKWEAETEIARFLRSSWSRLWSLNASLNTAADTDTCPSAWGFWFPRLSHLPATHIPSTGYDPSDCLYSLHQSTHHFWFAYCPLFPERQTFSKAEIFFVVPGAISGILLLLRIYL